MREFGTDKGREGVQNPENLADVICTSPLLMLIVSQLICHDMKLKTQLALPSDEGLRPVDAGVCVIVEEAAALKVQAH